MPAAVSEVGLNWLPLSKTNEIYALGSSTLKQEIVFSDPDQVLFNDCYRILSPCSKKKKKKNLRVWAFIHGKGPEQTWRAEIVHVRVQTFPEHFQLHIALLLNILTFETLEVGEMCDVSFLLICSCCKAHSTAENIVFFSMKPYFCLLHVEAWNGVIVWVRVLLQV